MTFPQLDRRRLQILAFCIGFVQIAGYYLAGMLSSSDGAMACPQPDTLLYCQAARRIAEGHPLSFAAGSAISTGTTSVIYPFILSIPYIIGMKGDSLLTAGFLLNAAFYLVFLAGWVRATVNWLSPKAATFAVFFIALSSQAAFCAMSQSDIGIWMALSGWIAAALSARNNALLTSLIVVAPWVRPEGMVCVIAYAAVFLFSRFLNAKMKTPATNLRLHSLMLGIASMAGVFALNWYLTGSIQFSSVANKGYLKAYPFAEAMDRFLLDLLSIMKCYLFGITSSTPRDLIFIPFLASVFIWLGIIRHNWRTQKTFGFAFFLLAAFGSVLTVAQSGWQDTNFDRYLVWILPAFIIFLAEGLAAIKSPIPLIACAIFAIAADFSGMIKFSRSCASADNLRLFAKEVDSHLPDNASIGSFGKSGITYWTGNRPYKHLWGIYSPEFFVKNESSALEILKNEPLTRFNYWFLTPDQVSLVFGSNVKECCGENLLTGPDGMEIRNVNWAAFDNAAKPHIHPTLGLKLSDRVDVAYESDEKISKYEVIPRYGNTRNLPFTIIDKLDGKTAIEGSRLIIGGDAMTVSLIQNKDVRVVMRTYPKHTQTRTDSQGRNSSEYAFANPLKLNVSVNDQLLPPVSLNCATNGFTDASFTIPGSAITTTPVRIAFLGDHIACAYWFYQ